MKSILTIKMDVHVSWVMLYRQEGIRPSCRTLSFLHSLGTIPASNILFSFHLNTFTPAAWSDTNGNILIQNLYNEKYLTECCCSYKVKQSHLLFFISFNTSNYFVFKVVRPCMHTRCKMVKNTTCKATSFTRRRHGET